MKKIIVVTICGIIAFIVVSYITNSCNRKIIDSIESETKEVVLETTVKYDVNVPFSEYNLNSYDKWYDYINYINEHYVDEKMKKFANVEELANYYIDWKTMENTGERIKQNIIRRAQNYTFYSILQSNNDWTDLPITENFRKKYNEKDGVLKYYNLPREIFYDIEESNIGYGNIFKLKFNEEYIEEINNKIYGKNYDRQTVGLVEKGECEFCVVFDDRDYIDNIYYLGNIMHEYIDDPDYVQLELELDDIDYIRDCVYELCVSEEYLMKGSYELTDFDNHISNMNVYSINYKYREKVFNSNGILPIKDYQKDSLEVISYDENSKEAIVKIETEDKKIYYKIKLNIDEYYTLEDADVSLYKEEKK